MHESDAPELTGKAATQERILAAAMRLFLEGGYEKTTMTQVAESAGVSRATVFWHFSDKKSLFRESFNRLVEPFRQSLERQLDDIPPVKRLQEQIAIYRDFVTAQHEAVDAFIQWVMSRHDLRENVTNTLLELHQRVAEAMVQTISEIVPGDVDPRPIGIGLITLLDGDVLVSLADKVPERARLRERSVEAFVDMIPRREGLSR